MQDLQQQQEHI